MKKSRAEIITQNLLRVRRVSPLLFVTAFGLAPYPSLAGRPIFLALFWLAPTGFRRFTHFPRDLSLAASSLLRGAVPFLCQSRSSRPTSVRECLCVQWWGDFPHRPESASGSRPSSLDVTKLVKRYIKTLLDRKRNH
jgi:hypothetical protein